ncbi:MAG: GTP 3',8-cyclase MoaA [Deltaproteobacteria bacterium]|nr:GTP 3',8-cyclase MoaA [Deltaproteobacteria bacterium]
MPVLKDQYHRVIDYLRISITDRCNLRCRYCMPEEGIPLISHTDILRYEEMLRVVNVYAGAGISKVRLTGGEPLVRRGIVDFVHRLAQVPGLTDLSMTSNGVLLKEFAGSLKAAGLARINVSLDTLNPEKFRHITRRDKFHDVWAGIEKALTVGLSPVKINVVTINGTNHDEILDFARLTQRLPLAVRFIEYMPTGNGHWDNDLVFTASKIREIIEEVGELVSINGGKITGPAIRYRLRGAPGEIGFINPISSHFCETCNRIRLTPDGHLRPCLFSDDEFDLKPLLRGGGEDQQLIEVLRKVLARKPKQHEITDVQFKKCQRGMSAIGG